MIQINHWKCLLFWNL